VGSGLGVARESLEAWQFNTVLPELKTGQSKNNNPAHIETLVMKLLHVLAGISVIIVTSITPALAEYLRPTIWTKGNLVVHKFTPNVCTNNALSGYYKVKSSSTAGRIYGSAPRAYGYMYAFEDTNGKERCGGNVQLMGDAGDTWSTWYIKGSVEGYRCSTVGRKYDVWDMNLKD